MPITAKNKEWLRHAGALRELATKQPKHGSFSYRMRVLMRAVLQTEEDLVEERQEIYDEFTKKDGDGAPVMVNETDIVLVNPMECQRRIKALLNTETTLQVDPIKAEDLDAEKIVINPDLAYRLGALLLDPVISKEGVAEGAAVDPPPE